MNVKTKHQPAKDPARRRSATAAHVRKAERDRRAAAYPKLVEALRNLVARCEVLERENGHCRNAGVNVGRADLARNLLRELGEAM